MNDAPAKLITISGIFCAPDNRPVPGITLKLRTRKYTNRLFQNEEVSCVTGSGGEYSLSVLPGDYEAACLFRHDERGEVLGVVHIEPYSEDGTLNDFLGLTAGMTYPPSIMIKIIEWVDLAEYYAEQARLAADAAGVNPRGNYDETASYDINDLVFVDGNEYRATADTTGISPPAAPWELFLTKGDAGPANVLTIGTVDTLPAGSDATAEITGEAPEQALNLGLPAGVPGDTGPANVLTIGTVDTLPPGTAATAEITGEAPEQVLNLALPAGSNGKITAIDAFNVDASGKVTLSDETGKFVNPVAGGVYKPSLGLLTETAYIHLDSADFTVDLTGLAAAVSDGSINPGYTLRVYAGSNITRNLVFQSSTQIKWIDGTSKTSASAAISSGSFYVFEVVVTSGTGPLVMQLMPK